MPKKSAVIIDKLEEQIDLLKKKSEIQKMIIRDLRKENMRLQKKFILYFKVMDGISDTSDEWMSTDDDSD
jgi:hypothetical protein